MLTLGTTALFGVLPALMIVPIWSRLASGIPRTLFAVIGMTWWYRELQLRGLVPSGAVGGLAFGLGVWLGLAFAPVLAAELSYTVPRHSERRGLATASWLRSSG